MFTGLIEDIGIVQKINRRGNTLILVIESKKICEELKLGDSVAINGVCLTVTQFNERLFHLDVMPETFKSSSLSSLNNGSMANLERAMRADGRFGGHFVSGHVDCVGQILKKEQQENAIYIDISVPASFSHLMIEKGSIAIDGTSLTIFGLNNNRITVSLIPHTAKESILGYKKPGEMVNIEFDMIGKYLHSFFSKSERVSELNKGVSAQFLRENGFM